VNKQFLPALLVVLTLGACNGAGPQATSTTSTTASTTSTTSTGAATPTGAGTTARPGATSPPGTTGPGSCAPAAGGGATHLQLTAVRVGTHPGYDRVTFEFAPSRSGSAPAAPAGVLPKYELRRVSSLIEDGSGNAVNVEGSALFQIVFQGASGVDLSGPQPVITYNGPREFKPRFTSLLEAERTGDFEATLSWGFGLRQLRCPRVSEHGNPLRLAVDFPH
jgi:hypothetical protein